MSVSDAILVGEGWISEHYFTTDVTKESFQARVLARRKEWDAEAAEKRPTPRSRFTEARQELEADLAKLTELAETEAGVGATDTRTMADAVASIYERIIDILELRGHGLSVRTPKPDGQVPDEQNPDSQGPVLRISAPGITDRSPLVVVLAQPVSGVEDVIAKDAPTLARPVRLHEDGDELTSAARLVSALFVDDDAPDLVLILAGRWVVLTEASRWAEGRYLAIDLQLICERNDTKRGGEIDRALTCLSAASVAPDADGNLWWSGVLEESIKHTVGVSKDLRDGVRLSIEIIANEVVARRRAKGLEPLPGSEAQPLAKQSLRFLYRILFLLYAEASPELSVLPIGEPAYDQGYSLDRLRELVQVQLATPRARGGTHLYESLSTLFRLVDEGHLPTGIGEEESVAAEGLRFNPLRADLFEPSATTHIDEVGLGNAALQEVLTHLLLSKEKRGKDRGFISYAELGINQLGAVYEGLMSYTGFFAETDLYEVAKGGDGSKGSWVVPVDRADGIDENDFVRLPDKVTGEMRPVLHEQGSFVFRLAGRERQQSASYYTPEVLTKFTVGQALEELLTEDTRAEEILEMTICEPALGSGAFAIEAVRQLAEQYLKRRQKELEHEGKRIDPDDYPRELQKVKAYLALHNVYGVDLNATAVELAEISLWLDTMVEGLSAPWFGLHLRRGNSLIGARRAVYRRSQVADKSWFGAVPTEVPLTSLVEDMKADRVATDGIHHFLLPADGWGSAADAKEAAALAPEAAKKLKAWRSSTRTKPTKQTIEAYAELAHRVESVWQIAFRRLDIAEKQVRRQIPLWEAGELPVGGKVTREQIEEALADEEGAYRRLRRAMDAWTALWFWPLTDASATVDGEVIAPPTTAQWIAGLQALLGRNPDVRKRTAPGQTLISAMEWEELGNAEKMEIGFAGAKEIRTVLREHPWLVVCERIAQRQGFFHWNLDFATVFARGGFDLQVGNPPWVRPDWKPSETLGEFDPRWMLARPGKENAAFRDFDALDVAEQDQYISEFGEIVALRATLTSSALYPHLRALRPDLYRCFMEQVWRHMNSGGRAGLIHPETHFTDEKAGDLRAATYDRLRRHWQFRNELNLFEVHHHVSFGVHIYAPPTGTVGFIQGAALYSPVTVDRSFHHDGSGPEPGLKDDQDRWDVTPHRRRIINVDAHMLDTWSELLESDGEGSGAPRMIYTVNESSALVLEKITRLPRIGDLGPSHSLGWDETADAKRGRILKGWHQPASWPSVVLQGPHFWVHSPLAKVPNQTMLGSHDWSPLPLESLPAGFVPASRFALGAGRGSTLQAAYPQWTVAGSTVSAADFYRVAWRSMADPGNERTLIPCIIPPGPTHLTQSVYAAGFPDGDARNLIDVAGWMGSLLADSFVRAAPKSSIPRSIVNRIPCVTDSPLTAEIRLRVMRLNCVTNAYAELWQSAFDDSLLGCSWAGGFDHPSRTPLAAVTRQWSADVPLRVAADRRQAALEIDVLTAILADITVDELCALYRTQFSVLAKYDRRVTRFDQNGRIVPQSILSTWRKKGGRITVEEQTVADSATTYELPFVTLDREADMRQAYALFEQRLRERS
ncbi:Eco57I restriction-modification methylase domain-containing protein [Actinoplanes sp. DH11]|uniref:Eco57I restriction-modification methylase domain-containing protein n=1 Tax=Actinoplanes sp. DH11 TaxID=2857011 RepID=UPI001E6145C8|nr:class I SAM-dependent DNA methyltransferase [Actinoplanes sp. DH11]